MRGVRRRLKRLGRPTASDVSSGAVTGLFSIPEGMAYAAIGGFNPVAGLYAGVVPAIVGSLASRTVLMVTTLTSAIALTSQSVLSGAGLDPKDAGNIATLTLMVGVVMLLMGAARLGVVMSFVSNAVMTGFSTGIALQIITGVLKDPCSSSLPPAAHGSGPTMLRCPSSTPRTSRPCSHGQPAISPRPSPHWPEPQPGYAAPHPAAPAR